MRPAIIQISLCIKEADQGVRWTHVLPLDPKQCEEKHKGCEN